MKFKTLAPLVVIATTVIQGCDSSGTTVIADEARPQTSRPTSSTEVDVFNDTIAAALVAPNVPATGSTNLFTNSGFEDGVNEWTECLPGAIRTSADAYEGNSALEIEPDNCFYRSVTVTPGESYTLSCFIKLTTERAWTGMGMAFSNSDYEALHEAPVAVVTSGEYMRLDTVGTAPAGTSFLSMWIHSDHGAVVDSCSLTLVQDQAPVPEPTAVNLLSNGDFNSLDDQGGATGWAAGCGGTVEANGSGLFISDGACADQSLAPSAIQGLSNSTTTFSCLVTEVEGYSDLSIFLDNELQGVQEIEPADKNKRVEVTIDAPQAGNGFVSLYSEGHLQVADCQLVSDNVTIDTGTDTDTGGETDPGPVATSARYRLTFNATWSAQTHALNFPPPAHFSGLVGAVHNNTVEFWAPGQIATDGIELMAETGDGSGVLAEVGTAVANGSAANEISGGGVEASPGSVSIEFEVTRDHPLITVTTMVAPSPDWFVGVHGLSLIEGAEFVESLTVEANVYDSGTDSGPRYTSDNMDTQPPEPIGLLTSAPIDAPFRNGLPSMGQFVIQKLP